MKKFRLLLVMSSLLALVCSFTACSTDLADNYPTISVEVTPGETTASSIAFTIKAQGADDIYYWVVKTAAEGEEDNPELNIKKGTYLDASMDTPFEQLVEKTDLAEKTEYNVYVYAKNFSHDAYATPIKLTTGEAVVIATPTVKVVLDPASATETSFDAFVTTENAQKASWLVLPKYTAGVNAAKVFAEGTAITEKLNEGEVAVTVEGLEPGTDYDFYVAVDNEGVQVLSEVASVSTVEPSTPVITVAFSELADSKSLVDTASLPGMYVMVANPETNDMALLFMYDLTNYPDYAGYLSAGDYPALTGSLDAGQLPEASCLLADPSYTNFTVGGVEYYPVGDLGEDKDGNVYGLNILTAMPEQDQNQILFNVPVVDAAGNEYILQGQYTGPLGYTTSIKSYPMNLEEWGFTKFKATVEGNVVTLKSTSVNGDFVMVLNTEDGNWLDTAFVAGEGGNLTGGFTSYLEGAPENFVFTQGRISFAKAEGENAYLLNISARAGEWLMQSESSAYSITVPEDGYYNITVELPAAEALSVDGKRWQLPSDIAEMLASSPTAVVVADLGVSTPGQLYVAVDYESIYGAQAAGMWAPMVAVNYSVEATDATSGKILVQSSNMYGEVSTVEVPYSNLTADSVTIDFTNLLSMPGNGPCTLYTGEVNLQGGGVM